MTNTIRRFCPVHGHPDDEITAWPCPIPDDDAPADVKMCEHFDKELARRYKDVTEEGNFFRLLPKDPRGQRMVQEYRGHVKYGPPKPL